MTCQIPWSPQFHKHDFIYLAFILYFLIYFELILSGEFALLKVIVENGSFLGLLSVPPRGVAQGQTPSAGHTMHRYSERICWQLKNKYGFKEKHCEHQKYGRKESNGRDLPVCSSSGKLWEAGQEGLSTKTKAQTSRKTSHSHFPPVAGCSSSPLSRPAPPPWRGLLPRMLLDGLLSSLCSLIIDNGGVFQSPYKS